MKSDGLRADQIEKLLEVFVRQRDYLNRLRVRMAERGFPLDDLLFRGVSDAADKVSNLCVVAASLRNEQQKPKTRREPTIMKRHPWGD